MSNSNGYAVFIESCSVRKVGLFIFLLFVVVTAAGYYYEGGFVFLEGLFVEVLGMLLELLVVLFVINMIKDNEDRKKKVQIERRLRELFIFFLNENFKGCPSSCETKRFYGQDFVKNELALTNLVAYVESNDSYEVDGVIAYCKSQKDLFNNLIPVVSGLTNVHFKSWMRITYFINSLGEMEDGTVDRVEAKKYIVKLLINIKQFDAESSRNDLYVGARESS